MKKNILPILFATAIAVGCSSSHERHVSNTDNTYNSPTYDRVVTESKIYSPASEDISSAIQRSSEESKSVSAGIASDSDRSVEMKVREAIEAESALAQEAPSVQISVQSGKVTLSGNVSSEQAKQQAETTAQKATGVVSVENQLVVSSTGAAPSPTSSSEKSRIYPETKASNTEINAPKAAEAAQASDQSSIKANEPQARPEVAAESSEESKASESPKSDVTADASVTTTNLAPTSDRPGSRIYSTNQPTATTPGTTKSTESTLVTQVRTAISGDTTLAAALPNLTITEDGGKVTLRGKVKSEQEKKDIEGLVQKTTGVTSVDNQLEVSTSP